MPSIGITGSATYSETLSSIQQMMSVLPDNTANQITARDVRDVTYTLYNDIIGLSNSVTSIINGGSASDVYYQSPTQSTVTVGGLTAGSYFNNISIQVLLEQLLNPYTQPIISLTSSPSLIEYGNTQSVSLTWNITKQKNTINSATIYRPTQVSYSIPGGSIPTSLFATSSGVVSAYPIINSITSFTFSINDYNAGDTTGSTYGYVVSNVSFSNKIYWGTSLTSSISTSVQITGLTGAGVGNGNEFSNTLVQNRDGINGSGGYLIFAWPSSYGEPLFILNGMVSTSFLKVNSAWTLTNVYGYTSSYDVWVSDNVQYSPIALFQIN